MNKYKKYIIYICISGLILILIPSCTSNVNNDAVIIVNNSPVAVEEFKMFLKDNVLQYEQALREELIIPDTQSVLEYLKNNKNKYRELLVEKNIEFFKSIKVQQLLGEKYKISGSFDWKTFNKELKEENQLRLKKIDNNEPVYGVKTFSKLEYYTYLLDDTINKLITTMSKDQLMVTNVEILNYYQDLESPSTVSGELRIFTICDITNLLGSCGKNEISENDIIDIQTQLSKKENDTITYKNLTFRANQKMLNTTELRDFVKSDMNTEHIVLSLKLGEVSKPFYSDGKLLIARYDGLKKAEVLFQQDKEMIKTILQRKLYEELISEEIVNAKVSINEKLLKTIM